MWIYACVLGKRINVHPPSYVHSLGTTKCAALDGFVAATIVGIEMQNSSRWLSIDIWCSSRRYIKYTFFGESTCRVITVYEPGKKTSLHVIAGRVVKPPVTNVFYVEIYC